MPKISDLSPTDFPSLEHYVAAAKDNETVRISIAQIRGLMAFAANEISFTGGTVEDALTALANDKADTSAMVSADNALGAAIDSLGDEISAVDADLQAFKVSGVLRYDIRQVLAALEAGRARGAIGADLLGGFRNKLINPDFLIAQRGNNQDNTQNGIVSVDRWSNERSTGCVRTTSLQDFTLGFAGVSGTPRRYLRTVITNNGGANDKVVLSRQRIEGARTLSGKKATLTFWARADAPRSMSIDLQQAISTDGSTDVIAIGATKFNLTTDFQKFTKVIDIPSLSGKTITATNDNLTVAFWFSAGSTYNDRTASLGLQTGTFDLAHVSLVEGDASQEDDPFSERHYQQEFALCSRYYQQIEHQGTTYASGAGFSYQHSIQYPVPMRASPNVTVVAAGTYSGNTANITTQASTRKLLTIVDANASGLLGVYNRVYGLDAEI